MKQCPFTHKACKESTCQLWTVKFREYDGIPEPKQIEGCVFNLILDELMNHSNISQCSRKELGEIKNNHTYEALGMLGVKEASDILLRRAAKSLGVSENTNGRLPAPEKS